MRCRCSCGCGRLVGRRRLALRCVDCAGRSEHANPPCDFTRTGLGDCLAGPVWRLLLDDTIKVGDYCDEHRRDMDLRAEWCDRAGIPPDGERSWYKLAHRGPRWETYG